MKKTVFALFAVLLVLSLASCDFFEPPVGTEVNSPMSPDDSREMVELTINVGGSGTNRALIGGQASTNSNKYEVVFVDSGGAFWRKNWNNTPSTTITIPVDSYTHITNAILFAGDTNNTLLAIGSITSVGGVSTLGGPASITKTSGTVTFTMAPLSYVPGGATMGNSSFQIKGPTTTSGTDYSNEPITFESTYPVFAIPANGHDNTSKTGTSADYSTDIVGQYIIECGPNYAAAKIYGPWALTANYPDPSELPGLASVKVGVATRLPPVVATGTESTMPLDGKFDFYIDVTGAAGVNEDGYSKVSIEVPVIAIGSTSGNNVNGSTTPITWYIKGGENNTDLDDGTYNGGAVLLKVGTPQERTTITITQ